MTLPIALIALIAAALGWGAGVVSSPRITAAAAQGYARELDRDTRAWQTARLADQRATCEAQHLANERAFQAALKDEQRHYSERIAGLRGQLAAHGIPERIVR